MELWQTTETFHRRRPWLTNGPSIPSRLLSYPAPEVTMIANSYTTHTHTHLVRPSNTHTLDRRVSTAAFRLTVWLHPSQPTQCRLQYPTSKGTEVPHPTKRPGGNPSIAVHWLIDSQLCGWLGAGAVAVWLQGSVHLAIEILGKSKFRPGCEMSAKQAALSYHCQGEQWKPSCCKIWQLSLLLPASHLCPNKVLTHSNCCTRLTLSLFTLWLCGLCFLLWMQCHLSILIWRAFGYFPVWWHCK